MNPGYASHIAGQSARSAASRRRQDVRIVYDKNGERLVVTCHRDQVERTTQRMSAAGVLVESVDGRENPGCRAGVDQTAYYDESWSEPLWVCEL